MGLFGKKKKDSDKAVEEKKVVKKKVATKKSVKKSDKKKSKPFISENAEMAYRLVVQPWVTEKTQNLSADNKYVFKVRFGAEKGKVKEAIENLYNIEVEKVNIVNIPPKKKRFGRIVGKRSAIKKAIVTVKRGQKIEIFE